MNYPNGNTVPEVKKSVSSAAVKIGGDIKSEGKDLKSETKSESKPAAKPGAEKASSAIGTVFSSALSFLPVKAADEAFTMLESTVKEVQNGLATARDSATSFVRKYPLYSLLGAAVIGASAVLLITMRKSSESSETVNYDA